jgi:hypothetical protein
MSVLTVRLISTAVRLIAEVWTSIAIRHLATRVDGLGMDFQKQGSFTDDLSNFTSESLLSSNLLHNCEHQALNLDGLHIKELGVFTHQCICRAFRRG